MSINPPSRSPHPSAPKSRPATTATRNSTHYLPSHLSPESSRSSSRVKQTGKHSASSMQKDVSNGKNDKATAALIRRVLIPQAPTGHGSDPSLTRERGTPQPLEELLPPLSSSNEVDLQLYALIAIVIKEFVHAWYSKITPDTAFTEEVIQVIAHCTRALEQRLRKVDIDALLLDELPALIETHILAYRTALSSPLAAESPTQFRTVYHTLNPHRALSPVPDGNDPAAVSKQRENEETYRQLLAQGILAVLLPTEDLENVCLRTLVGDILADLLLGEIVSDKLCEGWFIWETVAKLASELKKEDVDQKRKQQQQLETSGRTSSGFHRDRDHDSSPKNQSSFSTWVWGFLQYCYMIFLSTRFVVTGLYRAASAHLTLTTAHEGSVSTSRPAFSPNPPKETPEWTEGNIARVPVIKYRLFGMVSQLVDIPRRMPWLGGSLALVQHLLLTGPANLGETGGIIDRFLRETIQNHLLPRTLLPLLLLSIRTTLFPANAKPILATSQQLTPDLEKTRSINLSKEPSRASSPFSYSVAVQATSQSDHPPETEKRAIKRACASSIASLIPRQAALTIFAVPSPARGKDNINATISGESSQTQPNPAKIQPLHTEPLTSSPVSPAKTAHKPGAKFEIGLNRDYHSSIPGGDGRVASTSELTMAENRDLKSSSSASTTASSLAGDANNGSSVGDGDGDEDDQQELESLLSTIETDVLDLCSDSYCNKHLMFAIVETVLVKVIPELAEHGVAELMNERGL